MLVLTYFSIYIQNIWIKDLNQNADAILWDEVWGSILDSSKNPDHQQIQMNYIHRTYLTPRKRHAMGISTSPLCDLCTGGHIGTYMHMFWQCEPVARFWKMVTSTLSTLIGIELPYTPTATLLNMFNLPKLEKRITLSGFTAAKKIIAQRWKPPHTLTRDLWLNTFLDIVVCEMSVARMHGACAKTIDSWSIIFNKLKSLS